MADPAAGTTNSFTTLTEADAYFNNQYNRYALWSVIADADKSRLLIEATEMMTYGLSWSVTIDADDYSDAYVCMKHACCEQAWALYSDDRQADPETKGISELTVETINIVFNNSDRVGQFSTSAINLLRDYLTSVPGSLNIPVVRA